MLRSQVLFFLFRSLAIGSLIVDLLVLIWDHSAIFRNVELSGDEPVGFRSILLLDIWESVFT